MSPIRTGIVGLGAIGKSHLELIGRNPDFQLVAAAALTQTNRDLAEAAGAAFYTDWREMIARSRLDALVDASPTGEHAAIAIACTKAGIHILIEKPLATSVEQGKAAVEAVERSGIRALVGHHRRHNPFIREAKEAVARGDLGALKLVVSTWAALKPDAYYDIEWRRGADGGPLITNLIHDLDSIRFICGEVDTVNAVTSTATRGMVNCDTAAAILVLRNGAFASISMSDVVTAPWAFELTSGEDPGFPNNDENHMMLMGSEGSLAIPRMELWRHPRKRELGWRGPFERSRLPVEERSPLAEQLKHFARVVRGEEPPVASARDGLRSLALTLAVAEAGRTGKPVRPDDLIA